MGLKQLENLPFRESIKQDRHWNRWRKSPWCKIQILLKGHVGRTFQEFYSKAAPLLSNQEHQPMALIMRWCFYSPNERRTAFNKYEIVDGLICKVQLIDKPNNAFLERWLEHPKEYERYIIQNRLPNNVLFFNGVFYHITEESKIGNALRCENGFVINPNFEPKWRRNTGISFNSFYNHFVNGFQSNRFNNNEITQFDADYFLHPELFDYTTYGNWIIDLSKCVQFESLKKLKRYTTRKNVEKHKASVRLYKQTQKERVANQHELLGNAMIDYNLRKEKEKQLRREKEQAEAAKSTLVRDAHGFNETSFLTYRVPVKTRNNERS